MDLIGLRIVITRPQAQAAGFAERLEELGAIPIVFPVIRIAPVQVTHALDRSLRQLDRYHWLVLTSVNGVRITWDRLGELGIHSLPESLRVAAIGPKTAAALESVGVHPDFVPEEYVAEAILPGLGEVQGRWVLLLRADIARESLPLAIREAGGIAHEIAVYNTFAAEPDLAAVNALREGVDVVTFTSSSTVRSFVRLAQDAGLDPRSLPNNPLIACIGPITAQTARDEDLTVTLTASDYTTDGLIQALLDFSMGDHHAV